ncbi:MAG: hypothetical protein ACK40Z_11975 [Dietzia sp.]
MDIPTPKDPGGLPPGPLTTAELAAAVADPRDRGRYVRIWHGVYRRDDQVDDLRLRSEALARTWSEGVLRGRSAALLWGDDSAPVDALPEIWLPSTRRSRGGRVYRYGAMPPAAVTERDGLRVTTPLRTCRDLACDLDLVDAVVAVERRRPFKELTGFVQPESRGAIVRCYRGLLSSFAGGQEPAGEQGLVRRLKYRYFAGGADADAAADKAQAWFTAWIAALEAEPASAERDALLEEFRSRASGVGNGSPAATLAVKLVTPGPAQ